MGTGEVDEPTARVVDLILSLAERISGQFEDTASEYQLTAMQAAALIRLDSPVAMHELASALTCDRSNITSLVDRLEDRDLVRRTPGVKDRRVKTLVLTPDGTNMHAELQERLYDTDQTTHALSAAEINQLGTLLQKMANSQPRVKA